MANKNEPPREVWVDTYSDGGVGTAWSPTEMRELMRSRVGTTRYIRADLVPAKAKPAKKGAKRGK